MTSKTRIPKAEITGVYGYVLKRICRKLLGEVPEPAEVTWHNRPVLSSTTAFGRRIQKWDQLDADLKSFATMAVSAMVGCSWCLDFGYFLAHNEGLDEAKASEVPRWRESSVFTPLERAVMGYAEAMTETPPEVTDAMVAQLLDQLGAPAMVELTAMIAFQNMSSRSNTAMGIESQGFSRECKLPLADPAASSASGVMSEDSFARHRRLLFTVAYEMLGSAADAEDVVQETWLRWAKVDHSSVRDQRAYLVTAVTRQALNRMRSVARRRENYIGEWLPEPLLTSPDVADDIELAESLSIAMLTILETLGPDERAVFVLREVFQTPYPEIAETVGKSTEAVRQIAHRARSHVSARRPRSTVSSAQQQAVMDQFLVAVRSGDLRGLLQVLAPDVVVVADGGGIAAAARRPIEGAGPAAKFLIASGRRVDFEATPIWLNGARGARIEIDRQVVTAMSIIVEDGLITHVYAIRNPHKLAGLDRIAGLSRT